MASIELINVTKTFKDNTVIENLNLKIEDGSFTVLVGPSGCGKTTLLRMIAGIGPQTSGQIRIGGKDVSKMASGKRKVAMVFQNYALYPTMTVRNNIEFGLKNNKVKKSERQHLVASISRAVGLYDYLDRMPSTLSGGQRQRVALARAMVKKPLVFLMDEPLSNLDAKLRAQMRIDLIELHKKLGATFVYVTHDQVEAMSMADTIALMNHGQIQQKATPEEIYREPSNLFVAQFIGLPPMNILDLGIDQVTYGFRPEKMILSKNPLNMHVTLKGKIITREMLGAETIYQVRNKRLSLMAKKFEDLFRVDDEVYIGVEAQDIYFFNREGDRIKNNHPSYKKYLEKLRLIP